MAIQFPIVPKVPGVPPVLSFPGEAQLIGSIQDNVLSVVDGGGVLSQGLAIAGTGISVGTALTSGLTSISGGIATASLNIAQDVANVTMLATGSIGITDQLDEALDALTGDTVSAQIGAGDAQWGIFLDGEAVILADSVISTEIKRDWHISDYPVEQGSFESYNKVRIPYEAKVQLSRGGTEADREAFLATLDDVSDSLDLYDVVTPEKIYQNANITHFDYRRSATNGVSLIVAEVWLQEVRIEAASVFTATEAPSGANQVNGGTVQTQPPAPADTRAFAGHGATGSW